jgi:hypothetical protein
MKTEDPFLIVGDANDTLTLTTPAAQWAVRMGNAEFIGDELEPIVTRAELEAEEHARLTELDADGDSPMKRAVDGVEEPPALEVPKRPYGNAPVTAWRRYAVAVDPELSEERAEDMKKAELMSRYGTRLGAED